MIVENRTAAITRFHPPLPQPIAPPGEITVEVLTPGVTAEWNGQVEAGARAPYVVFAMSEQDWLTLGRWQQDVLRYLAQSRALIEFYRAEKDMPRAGGRIGRNRMKKFPGLSLLGPSLP